jgi:SPP1 gp7 family putative phage head morphogenesis protein
MAVAESINKKLVEKAVLQALTDARYTTGQRKAIMKQLSGTVDKLVAELSKLTALDRSKSPRRRKQIIASFLQDAEQIIEKDFKAFEKSFTSEMSRYAVYESEAAAKTVNTAVGVNLVSKTLTEKQAAALVSEAWIANKTVNEYFKGMQESLKADLFSVMRRGYLTGESTESLIRKIRGYVDADGIQHAALIDGATRKSAERAVRTMVMGIANEARHKTLVEDADVVKGFQWVATLDGRTCADCASRDGLAWDLDGNGLDGNTFPYETPPIHASCRCTLAPVLKSWEELGMDLPEFDPSTRASMDGQVSDTLDFKEWFDSKGAAFQAKWLGPGRYELWQKGKITFRDLVDQNGRELTLAQLKELVDD